MDMAVLMLALVGGGLIVLVGAMIYAVVKTRGNSRHK